MKRANLLFLGCAAAVIAATALAAWPQRAQAIVNGELDGDRHPNVGQFIIPQGLDVDGDGLPDRDIDGDGVPDVPAFGVNLTLIHPRVAIGCAHGCKTVLDHIEAGYYTLEDVRVGFSPEPRFHPETWREVAAIILHPDFEPRLATGNGLQNTDLAVVILREPAVGVTPATLAPAGFLDFLEASGELDQHSRFTVVGFGDYGRPPNQVFPRDGRRRVAWSEFRNLHDRWLFLDQNAAHGNGGSDTGDSGGPTFWVDPDTGATILVALILSGDAVGVATGNNFRTDTAEVLDFVGSAIAMVEAGAW